MNHHQGLGSIQTQLDKYGVQNSQKQATKSSSIEDGLEEPLLFDRTIYCDGFPCDEMAVNDREIHDFFD